MFLTVIPAYNRDYKSGKEVQADWDANKDFKIEQMLHPDNGRYINKQDCPKGATLNIRYAKMTKVKVIKVA